MFEDPAPIPAVNPPIEPVEPPPQIFTRVVRAIPPQPKEELIEAVKKFLPGWIRQGQDYNDRKLNDQLRLENLFLNRLPLDLWNADQATLENHIEDLRRATDEIDPSSEDNWRSQLCLSIANLVLTYVDSAFYAIFSTEEWLRVRPESRITQPSTEDPEFSTSEKLQIELTRCLEEGKVRSSIYKLLLFSALYKSAYVKPTWDEQYVPAFYEAISYEINPITGEEVEVFDVNPKTGARDVSTRKPFARMELVRAVPQLQVLKPDEVIIDTSATTGDVQSWCGVAHKFEITWHAAKAAYESGRFNVNEKEFDEKWPEASSVSGSDPGTQTATDSDRKNISGNDLPGKFQGWEYQGRIPMDSGSELECVCTYLADNKSKDPDAGILVRVQVGTALWCGRRTILRADYTEWPDGGLGIAEPNLDIVWVISHFLNLIIDNLRLIINAEWEEIASIENLNPGKEHRPGQRWRVPESGAMKPLQQPQIDMGAGFKLLEYLGYLYESRSGNADATGRISRAEKTAREISFLESKLSVPVANRLQLFRENLLNPALTLSLAMVQQFNIGDKEIPIKNKDGIEVYQTLSEEEISTGRYAVTATLGNADSTKLAVAQTLDKVIQTIANIDPILEKQGIQADLLPLLRTQLEKLDVPWIKDTLKRMAPPMQQVPPNGDMVPPPGPGGNGQIPQPQGMPGQFQNTMDEQGIPRTADDILAMLDQTMGADLEGRTGQI